MARSIRVDDDIYTSLLQIAAELTMREKKKISLSEAIRMAITFNPALDLKKLPLKRTY